MCIFLSFLHFITVTDFNYHTIPNMLSAIDLHVCVWWTEIGDERRRLKAMTADFNEQEKMYEEQRRRHIAQQQRVKKEERKAAAEAQQLELYVHCLSASCLFVVYY